MNDVIEAKEVIRCPVCQKDLTVVTSKSLYEKDGIMYCSELCYLIAKKYN